MNQTAARTIFVSASNVPPAMKLPILELLHDHRSLACEQIAAHLNEPSDAVRQTLSTLSKDGLVYALNLGETYDHSTGAAIYWRLSNAGRAELSRCG
jgi:predicted ArsR family transcriptional regulator